MSEILKPEEDLIMDKDDVVEREEELDEDNEDLEREEAGKVISINQKNNNHVTKTVKIVNYDVEEEEPVVEQECVPQERQLQLWVPPVGQLF